MHIKPIYTARRHHVAQALQRRAHQGRPTIPFIEKLHRLGHRQTLGDQALAQGRHLAGDSLGLGLLLGRDTCIDCYLCWIHGCCLPPTCCIGCASTACRAPRARGAGRRVMGTTRSYACTTQAALTRLGSNVIRTSRVVLPVCPRRATLASLHPWRGAFTGWHALERCPQQSIPVPGSQLCSWNTCRELYRQVSNFVGSVVSPLLANIYLHALDTYMESTYLNLTKVQREKRRRHGQGNALYVRYCDDFVVFWNGTKAGAHAIKEELGGFLNAMGLTLSEDKTHVTHVTEGFDFLGYRVIRSRGTKGNMVPKGLIPEKAVDRCRKKIRAMLAPSTTRESIGVQIQRLNWFIRGWCEYYRSTSSPARTFKHITQELFWDFAHWLGRKHESNMPAIMQRFRKDNTFGTGTIKLVLPTAYKAKRYRARTWHNPYTEQDEVKKEKERMKRESLFSYDDIHAGESRPGQGDLREEVLLRDGPICAWCKKAFNPWEVQVDHIKPYARFKRPQDADRLENLQVLCTEHHRAKTKTDLKVLSRVRSKPHARF